VVAAPAILSICTTEKCRCPEFATVANSGEQHFLLLNILRIARGGNTKKVNRHFIFAHSHIRILADGNLEEGQALEYSSAIDDEQIKRRKLNYTRFKEGKN
jgi:hypothetical protein